MNITTTVPRAVSRQPLSDLSKLSIGSLAGVAVALGYMQAIFQQQFAPDLTAFAGVAIVLGVLVGARRRWAPLVGGLYAGLLLIGNWSFFQHNFTYPQSTHAFIYTVLVAVNCVVGVVAGFAATGQAYRTGVARAPRGTAGALLLAVGVAVGMLTVGGFVGGAAEAGISADALASLPALETPGKRYSQPKLEARAGELFMMRLDNGDSLPHNFVIDELGVKVEVPAGRQGLILFTPEQPGTYTFYCDHPGHRDAGMAGTLTVSQ